ncbi:MAG: hypothetical protein HIU85_04410 [Proteobacteria bacterium]|nr:hypothetical protein [Pseudomonadota bacterium]
MMDFSRLRALQDPTAVRECIGDGNFGGRYGRSDEEMPAIRRVAVAQTRATIDGGW